MGTESGASHDSASRMKTTTGHKREIRKRVKGEGGSLVN